MLLAFQHACLVGIQAIDLYTRNPENSLLELKVLSHFLLVIHIGTVQLQ